VVLRLRSAAPRASRPSVLLALFDGASRLSDGQCYLSRARLVSNGGTYACPPGGVSTPRTQLPAGTYILIPSTFDPFEGGFELLAYAADGALRVEQLAR